MIYLKGAMAALSGATILTKILIALGLVATLAGFATEVHHIIYQSGVRDTIAGIARADAKLIERATKARGKLKECQAQNREWDQSTGGCT